jgi:TRAP-type mannitol/chloroaromatic compound transport system permease small subunit
MIGLIEKAANGTSGVVRHVGQVAAWLGLALVLLVATNVLARYVLGISSVASQEAEWHLMAAGAVLGMSYGLNQGGEVRVDVLYDGISPRLKAIIDMAAALMLMLASLFIVWLSIAYVRQSYMIGEISPDPGGLRYRFLLKALIPFAFSLLALQALSMMLEAVLRLLHLRQRDAIQPETN